MSISLLEIVVGLSGILVVPFLSYHHYYVEQIGQLVLTIGFFASFPAGTTLSVLFLCLNLACYLGRDVSTWRTRFAAGVFLAVQAAPKWHLVALAALYSAMVVTVTVAENKDNLQGWFRGKKQA